HGLAQRFGDGAQPGLAERPLPAGGLRQQRRKACRPVSTFWGTSLWPGWSASQRWDDDVLDTPRHEMLPVSLSLRPGLCAVRANLLLGWHGIPLPVLPHCRAGQMPGVGGCGDAAAAAGEDHGGQAVAAAVVQHVQAGHVTQPGEGRTYPGLVIEVSVVAEAEGGRIGPEGR